MKQYEYGDETFILEELNDQEGPYVRVRLPSFTLGGRFFIVPTGSGNYKVDILPRASKDAFNEQFLSFKEALQFACGRLLESRRVLEIYDSSQPGRVQEDSEMREFLSELPDADPTE